MELVLYFKLDQNHTVWLLWCGHIRVEHDKSNGVRKRGVGEVRPRPPFMPSTRLSHPPTLYLHAPAQPQPACSMSRRSFSRSPRTPFAPANPQTIRPSAPRFGTPSLP